MSTASATVDVSQEADADTSLPHGKKCQKRKWRVLHLGSAIGFRMDQIRVSAAFVLHSMAQCRQQTPIDTLGVAYGAGAIGRPADRDPTPRPADEDVQ